MIKILKHILKNQRITKFQSTLERSSIWMQRTTSTGELPRSSQLILRSQPWSYTSITGLTNTTRQVFICLRLGRVIRFLVGEQLVLDPNASQFYANSDEAQFNPSLVFGRSSLIYLH